MDLPQAVLEWDRGTLEAECDRAASVQSGVETYLGRSVFSRDGELVVRVALSRVEEGGVARVSAKVTQHDASGKVWGERTVTGDSSCASLDEPLTLVVALMVDAPAPVPEEGSPEATPPAPAPPPEPAPLTQETGEIQTAPGLARAETTPGHAAFLALGVASMGALPGAGVGGRALATWKPRAFIGLALDAMVLAPQEKKLGSGSLELSLLAFSGSICPLQGVDGPLWYSACASFGAARLRAESRHLLQARSRSQWIAMPSLGARGAWVSARGWMLGGGLDAAFPLSADRYTYRDPEGQALSAHELNPLVVTASLGVGLLVN